MDNNRPKSGDKFKNVFMQETSPKNPYGPNYYQLPYNTKIGYKFSKMKGYIRPTKQDLVKKEDQESKLIGTILIGIAFGALIGGAGRMITKRFWPNFDQIISHNQHFYYPIFMTLTASQAYFRAYQRYYEEVSKYFINKYLKQAIENGFEDYEISK